MTMNVIMIYFFNFTGSDGLKGYSVQRRCVTCYKHFYYISCCVRQGLLVLRKAETAYVKNYVKFYVFDIANQLLTRHSHFTHSVRLMNKWKSFLYSQFKVVCRVFLSVRAYSVL